MTLPIAGTAPGRAGNAYAASGYRIAITDHVSNRIMVFDRASANWNGEPLWSFSPGSTDGWNDPLEFRMRRADFAGRTGTLVMVTHGRGSSGRVGLLRLKTEAHQERNDLLWTDHPTTYFLDAAGRIVDRRTRKGTENYKARLVTDRFQ